MKVKPSRSRRPAVGWAIAAIAGVLALVILAVVWRPRASAFHLEPNPDQNVLLVTIDTLRADALSSYGGPARTPNLDSLAAHGARFTFAHAHAVVTLPSHTTILTGRLPYEHGMRDNSGFRVKEGHRDAGDPAQGGRLCDRRVRRRVSAHETLRPRRRDLTSTTIRCRKWTARSRSRCPSGGPTWSSHAPSTGSAGRPAILRLGARLRPALAL